MPSKSNNRWYPYSVVTLKRFIAIWVLSVVIHIHLLFSPGQRARYGIENQRALTFTFILYWISCCVLNLFNSAICLLFISQPKFSKKINKTWVEVIETPKLNTECFSFLLLAGIFYWTLMVVHSAVPVHTNHVRSGCSPVSGTLQGRGSHCPKVWSSN